MKIEIERKPAESRLQELGVTSWPIWEKEVSEFPWTYQDREMCYIVTGKVIVTPDGGEPVELQEYDLVTFPKGMSCNWKILKDIKKHYNFG